MSTVTISEIKNSYTVKLHRANETVISEIPFEYLNSVSHNLCEIKEISLTVNKYYINQYERKRVEYLLYDEFINERMISLDGELFVIKNIKENDKTKVKEITAYGKQKKLEKNYISVSDIGFYIVDKDEENDIYSLDEYMYEQTGWRFGHVDDLVRYRDKEKTIPRMRWQEDVETDWYDYLNNTLSKQFNCITIFNNEGGLVDLYHIDGFGDKVKILLSYDNYLKELERTSNTSDIVTKLKLVGNEDKCIIEDKNPTGLNYIENYDYFKSTGDMSEGLISALDTYDEVVKERTITWRELNNNIIQWESQLTLKKNEEYITIEMYRSKRTMLDYYLSKVNTEADVNGTYADLANNLSSELEELKVRKEALYLEVQKLEQDIALAKDSVRQINILCRKPTATDNDGNLIFNQELLDELKKFIFSDTFSDDSFYDAEEMLEVGIKQLEDKSKPTKEWSIDVNDFTERLITPNRGQWNGKLGLGDIVGLYDIEKDTYDYVYFVGYEKNFKDKSLSLTLSNKKGNDNAMKTVKDLIKLGKILDKQYSKNKRLVNDLKYNRLNMDRKDVK